MRLVEKLDVATKDEAAAKREAEEAAKQEVQARHGAAMNQVAGEMRERTTRHEATTEDEVRMTLRLDGKRPCMGETMEQAEGNMLDGV